MIQLAIGKRERERVTNTLAINVFAVYRKIYDILVSKNSITVNCACVAIILGIWDDFH